ncbi:MAG: glycosyltransferase [Pseudomonadota bacterium]
MMPQISVVIPCFNAMETLPRTIDVLASQTCRDWEALCIDDGSTDDTARILEDASIADPRIRVLRCANGGPARARNRAAEIARGAILAFLDADDVWQDARLQQIIDRFRAPDAPDAVFGKTVFFQEDPSRPTATATLPRHPLSVPDFLGENPVCTMSNLSVRTEVFARTGGFNTAMRYAEDLEWLVRLTGQGARVVGDPLILTFYRTSLGGLSSNLEAMHIGWRQAMQTAREVNPSISQSAAHAAEAVHLRYLSRRALRTQLPAPVVRGMVMRALRRSPAGFFSDPRRGLLILAAALVQPLLPSSLRRAVF